MELAKKQKKDRFEKLAAVDFEALPGKFNAAAFSKETDAAMHHAYLAVATLHQTKGELERAFREIPEVMAGLADATTDAVKGLRELASLMETAHARMLCAAAAHVTA